MTEDYPQVVPFQTEAFRSYAEFEAYLRASDAERGARWLYERSLASRQDEVVLAGTCGICVQPTVFTSPTAGGEKAPGGRVPNWREGQSCNCEHRLISRERALLHLLLAHRLLRPWSRVLVLGDSTSLRPALAKLASRVEYMPGALEDALPRLAASRGEFHLIVSVEQLTAGTAQPGPMRALARLLTAGGVIVFTAPFSIGEKPQSEGPVGWAALAALTAGGFMAPRVHTYWSEEFGYLGAYSMMIVADAA